MAGLSNETIAAQATPPGRGGVGIVRVSGNKASAIAEAILKKNPTPRYAHYGSFYDAKGDVVDQGIALYFPGPNSFTGEDVLELQGHGGPVVLDFLLKEVMQLGARLARPGEFSERAFLNDKIDLTQAEAIADLIDGASEQAVRCAMRSLQGEFSRLIESLVEELIQLRIYVEAAIDFPEEEVDFLSDGKIASDLESILESVKAVLEQANQGSLLREGMTVVIAGRPNAGKSSLLNMLSGRDAAIVTDIAGTTRDVLREQIHIDGMPLHIIDTAGLRESNDKVEMEGVRRAWDEIKKADLVLLVVDSTETDAQDPHQLWPEFVDKIPDNVRISVVRNKCDVTEEAVNIHRVEGQNMVLSLSAKTGDGVDLLRGHLKEVMGYNSGAEGGFIARRRHLEALTAAQNSLLCGQQQLNDMAAGELLAEDLKEAQRYLSEITGQFSSDDLLGRIFSDFCIGK